MKLIILMCFLKVSNDSDDQINFSSLDQMIGLDKSGCVFPLAQQSQISVWRNLNF